MSSDTNNAKPVATETSEAQSAAAKPKHKAKTRKSSKNKSISSKAEGKKPVRDMPEGHTAESALLSNGSASSVGHSLRAQPSATTTLKGSSMGANFGQSPQSSSSSQQGLASSLSTTTVNGLESDITSIRPSETNTEAGNQGQPAAEPVEKVDYKKRIIWLAPSTFCPAVEKEDFAYQFRQKRFPLIAPTSLDITKWDSNSPASSPDNLNIIREYHEYRLRQHWWLLRDQGIRVPFAPFEPEYDITVTYPKEEPFHYQLVMLVGFFLWHIAAGSWLAYRVWALHRGYSPHWHGSGIHNDLRYDKTMWALYRNSLPVLISCFLGVTVWTLFQTAKWWKDLIPFLGLRISQRFCMYRRHLLHHQNDVRPDAEIEKAIENGLGQWDWDLDWEESKIKEVRDRVWWGVRIYFYLFPLVLLIACAGVMGMKNKCTAHDENDKWMSFGYTIKDPYFGWPFKDYPFA